MHHDAPRQVFHIAFTGPPPKLNLEPKNDWFPQGIGLQRPQVLTVFHVKISGEYIFSRVDQLPMLGIVIPFRWNLYDGYINPT